MMDIICCPNGPLGSNSYAVIFDEGYVIIDPSCDPLDFKDYFERNNLSFSDLKGVFMTHGHFDHIMHVDSWHNLFDDVPFYISSLDFDLLDDPNLNCSAEFGSTLRFGVSPVSYQSLNNTLRLSDSVEVRIIDTPGHTKGSVVLVFTDLSSSSSVMISGDVLFKGSIGRTDFATGDYLQMKESISILKNYPINMKVYPGHGPSTSLDVEKNNNPYFLY